MPAGRKPQATSPLGPPCVSADRLREGHGETESPPAEPLPDRRHDAWQNLDRPRLARLSPSASHDWRAEKRRRLGSSVLLPQFGQWHFPGNPFLTGLSRPHRPRVQVQPESPARHLSNPPIVLQRGLPQRRRSPRTARCFPNARRSAQALLDRERCKVEIGYRHAASPTQRESTLAAMRGNQSRMESPRLPKANPIFPRSSWIEMPLAFN